MRILILGAGFAGLAVAEHLQKHRRKHQLEITLVNRDNFMLFTPMLHEVASSELELGHVVSPVRRLVSGCDLVVGEVDSIDLAAREVTVRHGSDMHAHRLGYDHLVLAMGLVSNDYGLPGMDRALRMKTLGDALRLRNHVIGVLEEADTECAASHRRQNLTFVVAGGGFAGVETVAGINDCVRETLGQYRNLKANMVRTVLVHSGPRILPELDASLGDYARKQLERQGVEVLCNTRVAGYSGGAVQLKEHDEIPACTMVWTAGLKAPALLEALPCRKERGRLVVDEFMALSEWPGVWALGDCALVPNSLDGLPCPPTAQHAVRQGRVLAGNILAELQGKPKRAFRYRMLGQLSALGKRTGVAQVLGLRFGGFVAWWLWRTLYLSKLPRLEKKLRVALDWTLDLFFPRELVQFLTTRSGSALLQEEAVR